MQQKTGRPVQFELLPDARASLLTWFERRGGTIDDYVFPTRVDPNGHLSTRQYAGRYLEIDVEDALALAESTEI